MRLDAEPFRLVAQLLGPGSRVAGARVDHEEASHRVSIAHPQPKEPRWS